MLDSVELGIGYVKNDLEYSENDLLALGETAKEGIADLCGLKAGDLKLTQIEIDALKEKTETIINNLVKVQNACDIALTCIKYGALFVLLGFQLMLTIVGIPLGIALVVSGTFVGFIGVLFIIPCILGF